MNHKGSSKRDQIGLYSHPFHKEFNDANDSVVDLANECERLTAKIDEMREDYIMMGIIRNIVEN